MASYSHRDRSGIYSFSSRPRAVEDRSRTLPPEKTRPMYGNIMFDRRVVRGNTYSQHFRPSTAQPDPAEIRREQVSKQRTSAQRRAREQLLQPTTPEPVQGRKHMDMQTELYLEELSHVVVTADMECQSDAFLDRPPTPLFIPAKSGKDVETQIEEGELFDFDVEVQPLLEVLVGKTMEQSVLEVMEEEELASLRAQQRAFKVLRDMEQVEVQRLQEQDRRRREERRQMKCCSLGLQERRITQQREALRKEKETVEKIAARAYTRQSLVDLLPTVFNSLRTHGYFYDPVERDIETNCIPWLMEEVHKHLEKRDTARQQLDAIIHDVAQKRLEAFKEPEKPSTERDA